MLNKVKIIVALVCVAILILVAVWVVNLFRSLMFVATEGYESPNETAVQAEETWVAPTMPPQSLEDIDEGLSRVVSETQDNADTGEISEDDEVVSVPVDETPDELADTTPDPMS